MPSSGSGAGALSGIFGGCSRVQQFKGLGGGVSINRRLSYRPQYTYSPSYGYHPKKNH